MALSEAGGLWCDMGGGRWKGDAMFVGSCRSSDSCSCSDVMAMKERHV